MQLNAAVCYRAVQARDPRYDGRFFTCVKTTGIYCRPVCPARPPKLENCYFVPTAAAAQAACFRPCLRCRPECAPELDAWRGTEATVSRALKLIERGALDDENVAALAERLGMGERQLRRLFQRHIGAAPITVAQTRRVLLAKQLIHETHLSMIEIALASGFGSVRRFNETFRRMYGRPPRELRGRAPAETSPPEITINLPYHPPYDWEMMLRFLRTRAIAGIESVDDDSYHRVISVDGMVGSIHVSHAAEPSALRVTVRLPRLSSLTPIVARVRRQFDLGAEPQAVATTLQCDPLLAPLVAARPGLRVPGGWEGFEIAVRAIVGQQISLKAALKIIGRLVEQLGTPVGRQTDSPALTHLFPSPDRFTPEALQGFGLPRARMHTLVHVAQRTMSDPHLFDPRRDLAEVVARWREIPGIGEWTAQYIAMRALGESDAFLAADVGLQTKCGHAGGKLSAKQLLARAESWRPWRAYATLHLWMADTKSQY